MLIPNTFKADIANNPKGNIKAEDLASLVAFAYPKQAGVLNITGTDCLGVANVSGTTATITINKGYIVVFGRLITIEQSTTISNLELPQAGEQTGVIGIKIDLAESETNEVKWFYRTGTAVQTDNLLEKPSTGVYEFVLYNYTATPTSLTISRTTQVIENIKDYLGGDNFTTPAVSDNSNKLATTAFVQNVFAQAKAQGNNSQTGYVKLDNGLIIKWGLVRTPSGKIVHSVNFDATVPFTQIFTVMATPYNESQIDAYVNVAGYNESLFVYRVNSDRTDCMYLAIGI